MIKNKQNSQKLDKGFDAWMLLSDDRIKLINISFKPGEGIALHANDERAIFYVLSGEGILSLEDEEHILKTGDSILINEELQRGWRNESLEELSLLVMKLLPV